MRIGLVTDTHVPMPVKELPIAELNEVFKGVEMILHAGDIYSLSVLNDLEKIAPVLAARGDDDYGETARDHRVQEKHVLNVGGVVIWLIHQRPFVPRMDPAWWQERATANPHEFGKPNIVVFGHEHRTTLETRDDVIYVNSGSPTFLHYQHGLGTYGIIETDSGKPSVRVEKLNPLA